MSTHPFPIIISGGVWGGYGNLIWINDQWLARVWCKKYKQRKYTCINSLLGVVTFDIVLKVGDRP